MLIRQLFLVKIVFKNAQSQQVKNGRTDLSVRIIELLQFLKST